ncbi:flagellar biosynthetic protein FliQ [Sphingomonas sp. SORGH_AS802]|jgi:flagellar biosynthetic protein FliQ|uniref:flagellar biosynthetic protein FliQ n=1 Tax=unclassified Sphingomonas TaxID=196159 RepID=UPI0028562304|nr:MULTISPECIES: flagellar biosynthetic protein FliQ [unclassified Sphingomonas]MDR6125396.1 flagellar biosynthetic protein FliQ [Sphingomonas sp. SORGH_AS_0438]MDR6134014.1 flagellar biosynthetic protein FliQ [Sphingomonas sp. SORGH_AS_0802]
MTPEDVMEIAHAAMIVVLTICGPLLLASLVIGIAVGLLQALTQIQEQTLTFVPKLMVMGVVLLLSMPMIGRAMADFTRIVADHIVHP